MKKGWQALVRFVQLGAVTVGLSTWTWLGFYFLMQPTTIGFLMGLGMLGFMILALVAVLMIVVDTAFNTLGKAMDDDIHGGVGR